MKTIIFVLVGLLLLVGCGSPATTPSKTYPDDGKQAQRLELINKLISQGIFQKVEKLADYPHVWVTPLFNALNFEDKQNFISVVFAYYRIVDAKSDMVVLYDSKTGNKIGVFSEVYGGLKMD